MKAGCPNGPLRRAPGASFISRRRWQLKKRKSSKQLCEKAKDGYLDLQAQPRSSGSHDPHWNRKFGHSRLARIASGLSRKKTSTAITKALRNSRFSSSSTPYGHFPRLTLAIGAKVVTNLRLCMSPVCECRQLLRNCSVACTWNTLGFGQIVPGGISFISSGGRELRAL